jgi:hypothetical protein
MNYESSSRYYKSYLEDPDHNIPVPLFRQYYTQDQKSDFIGYIINDKMNISAASKKASINVSVAHGYYHKYFKEQNPGIATPSHIVTHQCYTQEQIKQVISYIVDDKMTVTAASRNLNICRNTAGRHFRQYLKDNNMEIPVYENIKPYSQGKKDELISYIVDDKMTIKAASKKANMSRTAGRKSYHRYLKARNMDSPIKKYTQGQINQLIGYIVRNKMPIITAAKKSKYV